VISHVEWCNHVIVHHSNSCNSGFGFRERAATKLVAATPLIFPIFLESSDPLLSQQSVARHVTIDKPVTSNMH
jgi:hypothetical protein